MAQTQLGEKLEKMSFDEALAYVRDGIKTTFGFTPKPLRNAIADLLNKFEQDYHACERERDAALAENNRLQTLLTAYEAVQPNDSAE